MSQEKFNSIFESLHKASIQAILPGTTIDEEASVSEEDIKILISHASILSLSRNNKERSQAYETISRLIEINKEPSPQLITAAEIILSRLGNFPGIDLLNRRFSHTKKASVTPWIVLEREAREAENTVEIIDAETAVLTDFQYSFFENLGSESSLSISAPTSAGKSFVLSLDLIRRIRRIPYQSIVYVVPTRALITEVSTRIRKELKRHGLSETPVRTAPFPIAKDNAVNGIVYVLTQERLLSLIYSKEGSPFITSLFIDEAHEIQKDKRGIVLHNAIDSVLRKFPDTELFFASPLIKNPNYLLSVFGRNKNGKFITEELSPVSQNIILAEPINKKPNQALFLTIDNGIKKTISSRILDFKFRDPKIELKANLSISISRMVEATIIYADDGTTAESLANALEAALPAKEQDRKVIDLINFIKSEIHEDYPLITPLQKGVAFHYGDMQSIIRLEIENLFKEGLLTYICCTSTLLQGVNLPAKHIIIENPHSGSDPMSRSDFLNLAGRAGRLLKEFHGNIWCIRPDSWKEMSFDGEKLQELQSSMSKVMQDGGLAIQDLLNGKLLDDHGQRDRTEAAFSKFFHEYLENGEEKIRDTYQTPENRVIINTNIETCRSREITIPQEVLECHKALRPDHLQALYERLNNSFSLELLLPLYPFTAGSKDRMIDIINLLRASFEWDLHDNYVGLLGGLAHSWITGRSIKEILSIRVNWVVLNSEKERSVSSIIREHLRSLEKDVRFKLVKYFSAYRDILRLVLQEQEMPEQADSIEPLHIYLEFGSCDWRALNLMALGLSRVTALSVARYFSNSTPEEPEEYLLRLRELPIKNLDMPTLCRREILDLTS